MELKSPVAESKDKKKTEPAPEKPEDTRSLKAAEEKETEVKSISLPANLVEQGKALVIVDQGTYELGMMIYGGVKTMLKAIDDGYKPIETAQKAAIEVTKGMRLTARAPYEEAKKLLEAQIWAWNKKVEEKRKVETKAVDEYVEKALKGEQGDLLPADLKAPTKELGLDKRTFKTVWKGIVVDEDKFFKGLALFPQFRKYAKINQTELNADAKEKKEKLKVPGVEPKEVDPFENSGD